MKISDITKDYIITVNYRLAAEGNYDDVYESAFRIGAKSFSVEKTGIIVKREHEELTQWQVNRIDNDGEEIIHKSFGETREDALRNAFVELYEVGDLSHLYIDVESSAVYIRRRAECDDIAAMQYMIDYYQNRIKSQMEESIKSKMKELE